MNEKSLKVGSKSASHVNILENLRFFESIFFEFHVRGINQGIFSITQSIFEAYLENFGHYPNHSWDKE